MTPTNAWVKLLASSLAIGLGVYQTTINIAGATQHAAIQAGVIAFAGCLFHSLSDGPTDAVPNPPKPQSAAIEAANPK